jgi:ABC-type antimicrobial peptide transport system permease subunit
MKRLSALAIIIPQLLVDNLQKRVKLVLTCRLFRRRIMALSVAQRTHEIGVRLALGASEGAVLRLVLRQGMRLVSIGLGIGAIVALALTRSRSASRYAVEPTDPLTFLAVAAALALTAATACLIPARRVLGIDPMIALRSE